MGIMLFSFGFGALADIIQSISIGQGQWIKEALVNFIEMIPKDSTTLLLITCLAALIMLTISTVLSLKFYNDTSA